MRNFRLLLAASVAAAALLGLPGSVVAESLLVDEISQYLIIGTGNDQTGDAINVQKTELGADQIFVSNPDPNLADVFDAPGKRRWNSTTNRTYDALPDSAAVFEGIDYSGNMAITSETGGLTLSGTSVYADDFAVRCASGAGTGSGDCRDNLSSPSSSPWYDSGDLVSEGDVGAGSGVVGDYNHDGLIDELEAAWLFINGLTAEFTITANLEYGSSEFNIDLYDTNNDGFAVIDIVVDGDWKLNDYDWILNGDGSTFAIFRIRGNTNMLMSNSSISLGTGGIGDTSSSSPWASSLGAIFVQYEEPAGNTDQVFNFSNVILNGVGFWDLNAFKNGIYNDAVNTELNVQNGQGCSQFISSSVTFTSSVRFNRCAPNFEYAPPVPEPATMTLLGLGLAGLGYYRQRRSRTRLV